ncbi:MAG: hypothetical protein AAF492_08460, partial [Verrucomicrobiota bacterium]
LRDLFRDRDPAVRRYTPIGLAAHSNGSGFRYDGSYTYGTMTNLPLTERLAEYHQRIEDGNLRFEYSKDVSEPALNELDEILAVCRERKIHVIPFLPPYAKATWTIMTSMPDYDYLLFLPTSVRSVCKAHGFKLHDFSDPTLFGSGDAEMIDAIHGSDITYLRLFIEIAKTDPSLSPYTALPDLESILVKKVANTKDAPKGP